MDKDKLISTLGLAFRANKIIIGYDSIVKEFKKGHISCVFASLSDESDSSRQIKNKCDYYKIPLYDVLTSEELSKICSKHNVKMISLQDEGFYSLVKKYI